MYKSIKNPLKLSQMKVIKKVDILFIALLILASFLALLSFFDFNKSIYQSVIQHNKQHIQQLSSSVIQLFHSEVERCFSTLENTETFLDKNEQDELLSSSTIYQLNRIKKEYGFSLLGVVDQDGHTRTTDYTSFTTTNAEFLDQVFAGEYYISDVIQDNSKETMILIAIPIEKEGVIIGALYAHYKVSNIVDRIDSLSSDSSYFQIIDSQGMYITKSTSSSLLADPSSKSIWPELEQYTYSSNYTPQKIKQALSHSESGFFAITSGSEQRFVSYQPLEINNWYVFAVSSTEEITAYTTTLKDVYFIFLLRIVLYLIFICSIVFYYIRRFYQIIQLKTQELMVYNHMFQLVLQKTNDIPFNIDLSKQEIVFYSSNFESGKQTFSLSQIAPERLKEREFISEESYEEYKNLYHIVCVEHQEPSNTATLHLKLLGGYTWFKVILLATYQKASNQNIVGVLENYEDQKIKDLEIERRKQESLNLSKKSERDFLTGLYNRETLQSKINQHLRLTQYTKEYQAFFIVDLDHFKDINDKMGHGKGDEVLQEVSGILCHKFRKDDIIGRLGGDEFVLLLKNLSEISEITKLASELNQLLEITYESRGYSVTISASIGISLAPKHGTTFDELYEKADIALYDVKRASRNGHKIYEASSIKS